jgi:hypothetical protein
MIRARSGLESDHQEAPMKSGRLRRSTDFRRIALPGDGSPPRGIGFDALAEAPRCESTIEANRPAARRRIDLLKDKSRDKVFASHL